MISEATIRRLRWHAELSGPHEEALSPSISACTAPGSERRADLDAAVSDFIDTLDVLNHELNGAVPSEHRSGAGSTLIPTDVAYAVAEVGRMLRETRDGERASWLVETAWLAVLAGDIDDLAHHLAEEEFSRDPRE